MIPIWWSGRGSLVAPLALLAIAVGLVVAFFARALGAGLGTVGPWPFAVGFGLVGAALLPLGLRMNRRAARTTTDPRTGAATVGPAPHSLYGLPLQWWSVPMLLLAGLLLLDGEPERRPRPAVPASPAATTKD